MKDWLYRFDTVRNLKERVRPYVTKPHDIYEVIREIGDAKVVYDVGASVGDKTLTFLRAFPGAWVVAFEPNPFSFVKLWKRTRNYWNRTQLFQCVVGEKLGMTKLHMLSYPDASSVYPISSFLKAQGKIETATLELVSMMTIDTLMADRVDLLKIDVEGSELAVLQGAARTLENTKNVFIEVLYPPRWPDTSFEVFDLLTSSGFKLRRKHLFSGVTESPTTFIKTIIVRTWMSP